MGRHRDKLLSEEPRASRENVETLTTGGGVTTSAVPGCPSPCGAAAAVAAGAGEKEAEEESVAGEEVGVGSNCT